MTIWFDVEDIFDFFEKGHRRLSGIQRLSVEVCRAVLAEGAPARFVRRAKAPGRYQVVGWDEVEAQLAAQHDAKAVGHHTLEVESAVAASPMLTRALRRVPDDIRTPVLQGTAMQAEVAAQLAVFGLRATVSSARAAGRAANRAARAARARSGPKQVHPRFEQLAKPGDTLLVLGAPWVFPYGPLVRWLRDERRMRVGVLVHDLVPLRRPEWAGGNTAAVFTEWYAEVLPFCDVIFSNSRNTAADVQDYMRESGMTRRRPVQPLPIGAGFPEAPETEAGLPPDLPANLPAPGSYALFVSTMEVRKNHALAVQVWSRLLEDVRTGRRPAEWVPDLVFAGRIGWMVNDLVQQLDNTKWLGGRIRMLHAPTDAALRALYQGCLFTLFPSLHEGWGLPVTESLALGKPCISSNAAALPEAGGALCRYFDPEDLGDAYRTVAGVLDDRPGLAAWEEQVRREYRPTPWSTTARALLASVAEL